MPTALKLRCSLPISTGAASARPSIHRPISAVMGRPFRLPPNSNAQQKTPQLSIQGIGLGGPTSPGARLSSWAHDKAPRRIKTTFSSSYYNHSIITFGVGGSSISVNPSVNKRAAFRNLSAASSSQGRGEEDSASGSQAPRMGVECPQNGDGSPRLSRLEEEEKEKHARLLTLPTVLTLARVAAVPAFVCTITDWLDGYLARKMGQGTAFGAFLDPVADKLMVAATLILLCTRPLEVPVFGDGAWLFSVPSIAIIGREITMSAVREWAASQKGKLSEAVAVNSLGKWKTATQMISLTILLACRGSSLGREDALVVSGVVLLYVSAWLAVWSLFVYMQKIWKVLLR
ncbi:hypothetical protein V2J09_001351 [Rumex salicifolius]